MKRIVIYLAVTFGIAWGTLIPAGFALGTFENGENSSVVMIGLMAVIMFSPLVGALVANAACSSEGRMDLGIRPQIKENVRHYLAAWFLPAILALLGCVVFYAIWPQWFDPTMASFAQTIAATGAAGSVEAPMPALVAGAMFSAITFAPLINMIPAFGEEVGWRGMLYPALAEHMSKRAAALMSGGIWGIWHAPVIAMGHNYGMSYPGFPIVGILTMVLSCTALSCWLSYLRESTSSVWPCALAHGAVNASANLGLLFCMVGQTPLGPSPLGLVAGLPMMLVGIVCLTRLSAKRLLS